MNEETKTAVEFNIIDFAKKVLNEIDSIRSYSNNSDDNTGEKQNRPVESRINAFFRLVGLPMFVNIKKRYNKNSKNDLSGERILTPGYFGGKFSEYEITNSTEVSDILKDREEKLLAIENKIGSEEFNVYMTVALKHSLPLSTTIIDDKVVSDYNRKVFKQLFPLVTSYLKVRPVVNEIARPFLTYTVDQLPDSQTYLNKPFIETVLRIRLITAENSEGNLKITDISNSIKAAIGNEMFKEFSKEIGNILNDFDNGGMLENLILNRLLMSLDQLAKEWVYLQTIQEQLRQNKKFAVYVKTSSAQNSPFGKRVDSTIDIEDSILGNEINELKKKLAKEQALQMLLPSDDVLLGTSNTTKNTSLTSLIGPLTKLISPNLEKLKQNIKIKEDYVKKIINSVEETRVKLEMMTGEFTGISIVDIIAVITALFALNKSDLLALLDKETKDEMRKDTVLKEAMNKLGNPDGLDAAKNALQNLERIVSWYFDLLNASVISFSNREKRNKKATNNTPNTKEPENQY